LQIKIAEIEKKALDWRLEKDIPYGISNKNSILDQWVSGRQQLLNYEEQEKTKPLTYSEKIEKQDQEELVGLCEYAIVNDTKENVNIAVFNNRYNLVTSADSEFVDTFYQYAFFIVIAIVIIAGTIVSEEFNKGTVKLLLVRPYKRIKILTAKFIACLIVLAIVYVFVALAQFVVGGCTYGFNNYTGKAAIYNFHTSAVETIGTYRYLLLAGVSILPKFLLIMTLAFSLSVIFVNSPIAIAIPLLGIMGEEIINELAYNFEKARFLRFFVTPNWDLSIYLFGKMPEFEPISLFFSLGICLIYFVIMLVIDMLVFKKKEIKNI
jgi:ABC-2 type transport system permease protein